MYSCLTMSTAKVYVYVVLGLSAIIVSAQAKCDCDVPIQHYKELGCEAVFAKPDDCCPSHYNCAKITARSTDNENCYLHDKEYKKNDKVSDDLTYGNCMASCFCHKNEWTDFTCAHIDCPEFLGGPPLKPGCIRVYKPNSCCSSGTECPPFDKLAKCEVAGKSYYEGQRFEHPDGKCMSCLCQKGFEGKFVEPFCQPLSCAVELAHSAKARKNCAPVYYGNGGCCPIQWECAPEDQIPTGKNIKSDNTCLFGNQVMKIGEKFDPKRDSKYSPEINCECRIPPLLSCTQKPNDS